LGGRRGPKRVGTSGEELQRQRDNTRFLIVCRKAALYSETDRANVSTRERSHDQSASVVSTALERFEMEEDIGEYETVLRACGQKWTEKRTFLHMFLGWRNNENTMNMEASKHTVVLHLIHTVR